MQLRISILTYVAYPFLTQKSSGNEKVVLSIVIEIVGHCSSKVLFLMQSEINVTENDVLPKNEKVVFVFQTKAQ